MKFQVVLFSEIREVGAVMAIDAIFIVFDQIRIDLGALAAWDMQTDATGTRLGAQIRSVEDVVILADALSVLFQTMGANLLVGGNTPVPVMLATPPISSHVLAAFRAVIGIAGGRFLLAGLLQPIQQMVLCAALISTAVPDGPMATGTNQKLAGIIAKVMIAIRVAARYRMG